MTGFYFQAGAVPVDWETASTVVLPNPEWARRDAHAASRVEAQLPRLNAHVWVATSGTSGASPGRVRWIALSKQAFLASARAVNSHLQACRDDVWAHALPIFHVGGLGILARAHVSGARVVPAIETRWDPLVFRDVASMAGATLSALVPAQIHDLVRARLESPPSLRAIVVGGARLDPALYRSARDLGWRCLPSYGLTETCSQVATAGLDLPSDEYPTRLPILPHADIQTLDDGRLAIKASSLLTCCAEVGEGPSNVWDPKRGGWLETEDQGRVADGRVEVIGRTSESVKVLGELVSLPGVESAAWRWATRLGLAARQGFDLAVVAEPHDRLGHELVLAVAGGSEGPGRKRELEEDLEAFCREVLLPFERIRRIVWVSSIPRTALGKVQRTMLARDVR